MSWKQVGLGGASSIARLCGEYIIDDIGRIPGPGYRIKVFERRDDFLALPNIRFRLANGIVDGTCGLGSTELEALQDAINGVAAILSSRNRWTEAELDWVDPRDF